VRDSRRKKIRKVGVSYHTEASTEGNNNKEEAGAEIDTFGAPVVLRAWTSGFTMHEVRVDQELGVS
jgi:hypothetical protein